MVKTRKFRGKVYTFFDQDRSKPDAEDLARRERKKGYLVRVTREKEGVSGIFGSKAWTMFYLWRRKK